MIAINDEYADSRDAQNLWDVISLRCEGTGVAMVSGVRAWDGVAAPGDESAGRRHQHGTEEGQITQRS